MQDDFIGEKFILSKPDADNCVAVLVTGNIFDLLHFPVNKLRMNVARTHFSAARPRQAATVSDLI